MNSAITRLFHFDGHPRSKSVVESVEHLPEKVVGLLALTEVDNTVRVGVR